MVGAIFRLITANGRKTHRFSYYRNHDQKRQSEDVKVAINLSGKHSRRGDSDNISGSILDVLVTAGILKDDNLKSVPSLSLTLTYSKDDPVAEIEIS
jgi:Holliday junction resolvase RusA-like endonuclease